MWKERVVKRLRSCIYSRLFCSTTDMLSSVELYGTLAVYVTFQAKANTRFTVWQTEAP